MPTGYTAKLYEGEPQTFSEFLLSCARAFGALILRDDPPDAPIPDEFEPSSFYRDSLERSQARLEQARGWTDEQWQEEVARVYAASVQSYQESQAKQDAMQARYEAMLEQVRAWEPPTPEHQGLRDFMEKQLLESIDFDCYELEPPALQKWQTYKVEELARRERSVAYDEKSWREEQERAARRTAWVKALRDSIA